MRLPRIGLPTEHGSEIGLLFGISAVIGILAGIGIYRATAEHPFDPSAYLVVFTLIVGAIKERWTQRSVDRMGQNLAQSQPLADNAESGK